MAHVAVVLEMVKTCKNKKSLDFNDIDKSVVKKALKAILRFNLEFIISNWYIFRQNENSKR